MKINLRSFVYLDAELVKDFLSQLDKGYYNKEKITDTSSERTVEQNTNSEFERLYEALVSEGLEKTAMDTDAEWSEIGSGEILELDMIVSVNVLNSFLSDPTMRALMFSEQSDDTKQLEQVFGNDITATAKVAGNSAYSFMMNLQSHGVRKPDELNSELTVLCKVHRKLKDGETQLAISIPNYFKQFMNKESDIEVLKQKFEDGGMSAGDLEIGAPGAILIPIAIYR